MLSFFLATAACLLYVSTVNGASDPEYDHQKTTYKASFEPISCRDSVTASPFFSPDSSIEMYVQLIESATTSIDLYTPGFSSWSRCTPFEGCTGCSLSNMRNESFPVFPALLNAVHEKNVKVRIMTNDYGQKTCQDKISPLDWLYLNGIEVKTFRSVTFMHSKVMIVDKGKKTSISSVNFSYTSFNENREAGVVMSEDCKEAVSFVLSVFEYDWNKGSTYSPTNTYSSAEIEYITNSSSLPVRLPTPRHIPDAFVTIVSNVSNVELTALYTSPDYALSELNKTLQSVKKSFQLMIYQITDSQLCSAIANMKSNGIDVKLLVSSHIFSTTDWRSAQACYGMLHKNGVVIQKTPSYYTYSHQKFWIVDGEEVHLSTGNWSPTDYPVGNVYPPYGATGWQDSNRNFIVGMKSSQIVKIFEGVLEGDWKNGVLWKPYH